MSRLRIAVVTPYFPSRNAPQRGHSAYQTLRKMTSLADIHVFCPVATYLSWLQPRSYAFSHADETFSPPDVAAQYYPYRALPVVSRPINSLLCRRLFTPDLRAFQPDVVLNYWLYPEGHAAVKAAHSLGAPAIVCSIGSDLRRIPDFIGRHFVRRTLMEADFVLTVSGELRQQALRMGATAERSAVMLNGCDSSIFYPASQVEARQRLGIAPDGPVIVFVGALIPSKGLNELLRALKLLTPKYPTLRVYCIGEGSFRPHLEAAAASLGLSGRFLLPGPTNSLGVAEWITASDVFCLPSHSEGCPNVVIEAVACGRPVVATDVGGVSELMSPQSGVLVSPHSASKLATGLDTALSRDWKLDQIPGGLARSWDDVARETFEVCRQVAARGIVKRS